MVAHVVCEKHENSSNSDALLQQKCLAFFYKEFVTLSINILFLGFRCKGIILTTDLEAFYVPRYFLRKFIIFGLF